MRREPTQQRGTQQYSGEHLADHAWLMKETEKAANDATHRQNNGNLQNQREEVEHQRAPFFTGRPSRTACQVTDPQVGHPVTDIDPEITRASLFVSTDASKSRLQVLSSV